MPLIRVVCLQGHEEEQYLHTWKNMGCDGKVCHCGNTMAPAFSAGRGLTYFEEGRARYIENLGGVWITSHEQHKRVMRERGVEPAVGVGISTQGTGWAHHLPQTVQPLPTIVFPNVGIEL